MISFVYEAYISNSSWNFAAFANLAIILKSPRTVSYFYLNIRHCHYITYRGFNFYICSQYFLSDYVCFYSINNHSIVELTRIHLHIMPYPRLQKKYPIKMRKKQIKALSRNKLMTVFSHNIVYVFLVDIRLVHV